MVYSMSSLRVIAGEHDIQSPNNDETEQTRSVQAIIRHPFYSESTQQNDIAILQLSSPLNLNSAVAAIKPFAGSTASGKTLYKLYYIRGYKRLTFCPLNALPIQDLHLFRVGERQLSKESWQRF
jgi:hypothetical protein